MGCVFQPEHFTGWGSEGVNGSGVLLNPEAPKQCKSDVDLELQNFIFQAL